LNELELTTSFELLQHSHRRYVLHYLTTQSETVGIETLAAEIAAWTPGNRGTDATPTEDAVLATLYHVHIPKLVESSLVTYDTVTRVVGLDNTDEVNWFLDDRGPVDGYTPVRSDD
jgi:hypothetical protein